MPIQAFIGYINENRKFRIIEANLISGTGKASPSLWRVVIPEKSFITRTQGFATDIDTNSFFTTKWLGRTAKEAFMYNIYSSQPLFITKSLEDSDFSPEGRIVELVV